MTTPPTDPRIPDLVSLTEAAAMLGITRQAAHLRAQAGQLPGRLVGKTWVFRRAEVEKRMDPPADA
jgi:hypothetical protein